MTGIARDLRIAARALVSQPGFTLPALLTLALGIGANTAIFSVVRVVLLQPLPYVTPSELVMVWSTSRTTGEREGFLSYLDFRDLRQQNTTFEDLSAFWTFPNGDVNLTGGSEPERVPVSRAMAGYFELLGVVPHLGRTFVPEENVTGHHRRALLSYGLWTRRFGADSSLVGRDVFVNGFPYAVVGVLPPTFRPLESVALGTDVSLWRPLAPDDRQTGGRASRNLRVVGRLKGGVTIEQAQAELDGLTRQLARTYPESNAGVGVHLVSLRDQVTRGVRPSLLLLLAAVGLVLLTACVNVAALLLVKGNRTSGDLAIRMALGASRARIARRLLSESTLLGLAGAVVGTFVAVLGVNLLVAYGPPDVPMLADVEVDANVLAFGILLGVITGMLFGLAPAWRLSRPDLARELRAGARRTATRRDRLVADALVVAQIAVALILVVAGGLLVRGVRRLQAVDPGIEAEHVLTLQTELPMATTYPTQEGRSAFFARLMQRIEALPGVTAVSMANGPPVDEDPELSAFRVPGVTDPLEDGPTADLRLVAPDYFQTLRIPLLRGRGFEPADRTGPPRVMISRSIATRVWADGDPVGQRIELPFGGQEAEVIGVVGDVRGAGLDHADVPTIYLLADRWAYNFMTLIVRSAGDPEALAPLIREIVREMDADLPLYKVRALTEILDRSIARQRFQMGLVGAFSGLALFLAVVGTYSVLSYGVGERRMELGIRAALGASPRQTLLMILRHGLGLASVGVVLGLAGAVAAAPLLSRFLYGVSPWDPATLALAPPLLIAAAGAAALVPARRATGVPPMVALRDEL
jgi:putative ABC transport system permease protein